MNEAEIRDHLSEVTPGPWFLATGCSWRRILTEGSREDVVCQPTNHHTDKHPDLSGDEDDLTFLARSWSYVTFLLKVVVDLRDEVSRAEIALSEEKDVSKTLRAALEASKASMSASLREARIQEASAKKRSKMLEKAFNDVCEALEGET